MMTTIHLNFHRLKKEENRKTSSASENICSSENLTAQQPRSCMSAAGM
jgi:hypothetical protein